MTAVMSAANEKAVEVFLAERIRYLDIVPLVSACCEAHQQARQQPLCCFSAESRRRVQTRSALRARVLLQCQNGALCFLKVICFSKAGGKGTNSWHARSQIGHACNKSAYCSYTYHLPMQSVGRKDFACVLRGKLLNGRVGRRS